jgi:hypothetical protein
MSGGDPPPKDPPSNSPPPRAGSQRSESPATYTRRRLLVAGAVAGLPLAVWLRATGTSTSTSDDGQAPTTTGPNAQPVAPVTSAPATETDGTDRLEGITRDLTPGMVNDDVASLQKRLHDLHFDPGPVDGWFGEATIRSVWAFEKLVLGIPRAQATGVVTPAVWDRMRQELAITPRRSTNAQANHTEIYLPEQVLVVFHRDEPVVISHIASGELDASGDPAEWCELVTVDTDERGNQLDEPVEKDICGRSKTPGGVFEYFRRVEGIRNGALGSMWNPVYFNYGIAIHGAINVPLAPASHGCIRIPMHISDYFQDLVANRDRVLVWNGDQSPEQVSERDMLPVFDYANPDATTTTTSAPPTTATVPPTTTTAPTTTAPQTTTVPQPAPTISPTSTAAAVPPAP